MGPHEIVIAAEQLQVIFKLLLPARLTDRPAAKIRRALSDREIQSLDKRRVEFR